MAILDQYGKPVDVASTVRQPSRNAGSYRGTISNWYAQFISSRYGQTQERNVAQGRAADLYANDWTARSGARTIADNAIGTGLVPKSIIPHEILGISQAEARAIGEKMEWAFSEWSRDAHARGLGHFEDLQYLGMLSVLRLGEMLHLPVMLADKSRAFSLAIQDISPSRLQTPTDLESDLSIRDGIEFSSYGRPAAYWIACPPPSLMTVESQALISTDFARRPAFIAHRPNVFHLFRYEEEEQTRGHSVFSPGMPLFRNLNDAIDAELLAQVIAASLPIFIAIENNDAEILKHHMGADAQKDEDPEERALKVAPGTVIYGKPNEKPYILESKRPSTTFGSFVEIVQRSIAAMMNIPYESLTKDFSKTNYSSMRAALNEAWKCYAYYRNWFSRLYTQPVWEMVIEEAYLRNFLGLADDLAALAPKMGFYEGRQYWTAARWIGPARGFIDPVKEIQATIMALETRLMTYADAWAERGGDFADALPVMKQEMEEINSIRGAAPETLSGDSSPEPPLDEDGEEENSGDENNGDEEMTRQENAIISSWLKKISARFLARTRGSKNG